MSTLNVDCDIILQHPDIDSGLGYGFILSRNEDNDISIKMLREVDGAGVTRLWVYFDVLLSSNLINPNGEVRPQSRVQDYKALCLYLAKMSDIALSTQIGVLFNLGFISKSSQVGLIDGSGSDYYFTSLGWIADERHFKSKSIIKCQVNNIGVYYPPVNPVLVSYSYWDSPLNWDDIYWVV